MSCGLIWSDGLVHCLNNCVDEFYRISNHRPVYGPKFFVG